MPEKKEPVHVGDEFTSSRPGLYSSPRAASSERRRPLLHPVASVVQTVKLRFVQPIF